MRLFCLSSGLRQAESFFWEIMPKRDSFLYFCALFLTNRFMRKYTAFFALVVMLLGLTVASYAQITYTVVSSSNSEVIINVQFPEYQTRTVEVNGETMQHLVMKDAYPTENIAAPELLQSAFSIIIPEGSRPTAEVLAAEYRLVPNFKLAPSKGRLYRNVDPATVPYQKGSAYQENRFLFNDTVALGAPYQLRDFNGVAVRCFPFAYNPAQQTLKVYQNLTVKIHLNSTMPMPSLSKVAKPFDAIYADHFLNYNTFRSTPLPDEGDMLIIAPDEFCAAMQPYVEWKTKTGYKTELVTLESIGTTSTAVKNYISNYYNNADHNLVYVLIVGDNTKFPAYMLGSSGYWSSQYAADNYYAEVAGNDNYPDLIIGKISAETVAHVTTQVERFIQYEQNPPETAHFPVFLGIASDEGGGGQGDNGEIDYQHIRNIGTLLSNFTYTSGYEVFAGSQGGLDQPGATAAQVSAAVNSGVGIINYCGHGSETTWVTTGFSVNNVNSLTNNNKLPFIISTACVNGDYVGRTCFAEAWMRATNNGQPTGAVSTLMSSVNQSWNPPMCGQDRMNEHLTGANSRTHLVTFGSIAFNGILHMLDTYNDEEVARTWILFGDPTLAVRTAVPQQLALSFAEVQPIGVNNISFTSVVENAKVVISKGGEIVASGRILNGTATLDISSLPALPDTLTVTAWAQNYVPYVGNLYRVPANGPYVICSALTPQDGNNNIPETGENVNFSIDLYNVGNQAGSNIRTNITTEDPYVTLTSSPAPVSQLAAGATATVNQAFVMQIRPDVPAFHNALLKIECIFNGDTTSFTHAVAIHAPQLHVDNIRVDDSERGNNNGRFDNGETVEMVVTVSNRGDAPAASGLVSLYGRDDNFVITPGQISVNSLEVGSSVEVRFTTTTRPSVTDPTLFRLHGHYQAGSYEAGIVRYVKVGAVVEDWESNNFTNFPWDTTRTNPWVIINQGAYEGTYAARSGQIGNNASSVLTVTHTNTMDDTLSFYYKVSSEADYDFLNFYIDNQLQDQWSGNVDWTRAAYYIPAGTHTYKWEYKKDSYSASGQDRAMIDFIDFPISNGPVGVQNVETSAITVSPNPTTGVIRINADNNSVAPALYQLFDLNGRLLQQESLNGYTQTIDIRHLSSGLYMLKVIDQQRAVRTFKIVKQ